MNSVKNDERNIFQDMHRDNYIKYKTLEVEIEK